VQIYLEQDFPFAIHLQDCSLDERKSVAKSYVTKLRRLDKIHNNIHLKLRKKIFQSLSQFDMI
jgi:hypothetical protein